MATCNGCGREMVKEPRSMRIEEPSAWCSNCGGTNQVVPLGKLVRLKTEDLELLIEALDSHAYWQVSDLTYRNSGNVLPPGSDDPEKAAEIKRAEELGDRLRALAGGGGNG